MSILATCPGCGVKADLPDKAAGRMARCRACGKTLRIPADPGRPCVICGAKVDDIKHLQDDSGNCYCQPCLNARAGAFQTARAVGACSVCHGAVAENELSIVEGERICSRCLKRRADVVVAALTPSHPHETQPEPAAVATLPREPEPAEQHVHCSVCGHDFPVEEMIVHHGEPMCPTCLVLMQRLWNVEEPQSVESSEREPIPDSAPPADSNAPPPPRRRLPPSPPRTSARPDFGTTSTAPSGPRPLLMIGTALVLLTAGAIAVHFTHSSSELEPAPATSGAVDVIGRIWAQSAPGKLDAVSGEVVYLVPRRIKADDSLRAGVRLLEVMREDFSKPDNPPELKALAQQCGAMIQKLSPDLATAEVPADTVCEASAFALQNSPARLLALAGGPHVPADILAAELQHDHFWKCVRDNAVASSASDDKGSFRFSGVRQAAYVVAARSRRDEPNEVICWAVPVDASRTALAPVDMDPGAAKIIPY